MPPRVRPSVVVAALIAVGLAERLPAKESLPASGTFFEEILTVQEEKLKIVAPTNGNISIPYTRVDVAIDSGVALTRLVQVYHNHGTNNAGYAFQMPLEEDTTLTQFTLWDQGKRYPASIEERTRAEKVYKEVTGEEAPSMNRDPGLVRTTGNRYEMRIFPIVPGENKQIELISNQRLGIREGKFVYHLPLAAITRPRDVRSGRTEISFYIKDNLPLKSVAVAGVAMEETKLDNQRRLFRCALPPEALADVEVSYELDLDKPTHVTPFTFSLGEEHYFLARYLVRGSESRRLASARTPPKRVFYMGVWRDNTREISQKEFSNKLQLMAMEFVAFETMAMLNRNDNFQGLYQPPRVEGERENRLYSRTSVATPNSYPVSKVNVALTDSLRWAERKESKPPPPAPDAMTHLVGALKSRDCQLVYLFLYDLPQERYQSLDRLIRRHREVTFILVTLKGDLLPRLTESSNVSHFSFHDGWQKIGAALEKTNGQFLSLPELGLDEDMRYVGLEFSQLARFWERLPNLSPSVPTLRTDGAVRIRDPQVFLGQRQRAPSSANSVDVVWMAGRFDRAGKVATDVSLSPRSFSPRELERESPLVLQFHAEMNLDTGDSRNRFVGSFHGRRLVEALNADINRLQSSSRGEDAATDAKRKQKIESARAEIVRLSRTFCFLSPETAFIALPEELQRKYGLTPQQYAAQQTYDLARMASGIAPEGEVFALILMGFATLRLVIWFRTRR